jgi:hypothetical protein
MACPRDVDGRDGLQKWRVAAIESEDRQPTKSGLPGSKFGRVQQHVIKKTTCYEMLHSTSDVYGSFATENE